MASSILVVDDEPGILKVLKVRLSSNGYEVLAAQDAALGLELAMKKLPDLIILDVMMPVINGYNFCRLLKSEEKYKNIPVLMLTSRSEEEDRKIGQEVGADAYMAKPFNMNELLNKVVELLNK